MITIYVVEDNIYLLEDIIHSLNHQGYNCKGVTNAIAFDELLTKQTPNLVILDWNLPGEDGLSIAQRLHKNNATISIGIIFLTARNNLNDKVSGLDYADSYLTKPIDYQELGAVIKSICRRLMPKSSIDNGWELHKKTLDLHTPKNEIISLSHREYIALDKLSKSSNSPVLAKDIVEAWGDNWMTFEKNRLELLLSRLRRKIKDNSDVEFNPIRSVRNEGYHLTIPLEIFEDRIKIEKQPFKPI